ncbi:MAG: hypothetical protein R2710_25920 [Acidimicrobiales bacterium]
MSCRRPALVDGVHEAFLDLLGFLDEGGDAFEWVRHGWLLAGSAARPIDR